MSRIYFHNIKGDVQVSGAERYLLGGYCSSALLFSLGNLNPPSRSKHWILDHIPSESYLHTMEYGRGLVETWLSVAMSEKDGLILDGELHPLFDLQLNSALAIGGDALKLAARIHGQCECHCFVEGKNRAWLADIIEAGRKSKIFRSNEGWEAVCDMLRIASDSPVVCSYSVCHQFPGRHISDWPDDEESEDKWYDLSDEEKWEISMNALRVKSEESWLELKPENWDSFHFAKGKTGFDFSNKPQAKL